MIEVSTPVWVKGTVVDYRVMHPHVMVSLEVQGADGKRAKWDIEGPNLMRLEGMHVPADFLKAGDLIEVCGFRLKEPWRKEHFIHGPLLVMPDGHMRHWGPYGKLENCIRPGDTAEKWVRFLKRDAMALPSWCSGRRMTLTASVAPAAVVEEIDRAAGKPCG